MSDKEPVEVFSPSKLGEYKVVDEIAEGTFGKVKSACFSQKSSCALHNQLGFSSGIPYYHRSEGSDEVSIQGSNHRISDKDACSARGGLHAYAPPPPHH